MNSPQQTSEEITEKNNCYKALSCLYIAVQENIADDVNLKVRAYISRLELHLAELFKDKERLDGAVKYIGNIDLYVNPVSGMMISRPMICMGLNLRECLDKITTAMS